MMCPEMEGTLNEYVDGTLDVHERAAADAHLADCAGCRAAVAELRRLVAASAALPKRIEPGRDLWATIEARLGQRAWWRERPFWAGALAAAALLVIALGLYRLLPSFTAHYRPVGEGWAVVQADYDAAARELSGILAAERERLRPETVVLVERNLAIIDAALADARTALERDPANPELRRLLAAAYRQKVELLRWAARGAAS
jgi:anti-sigma-K factor RskA